MSYELCRYIFIGGLVLSIIMLLSTVAIFFLLNIRKAIGDITGSNKKKAIENIHSKNVVAPLNKKASVKYDYEKQTKSSKLASESMETSKISPQDRYDSMGAFETTALNVQPVSETTVLNAAENPQPHVQNFESTQKRDSNFYVEVDITYVHSNEIIK